MSPRLRIAVRFLLAKKRSMLMSLAGIVFGVGFFVVTQAQTSGFEAFFIRTILGTNGAIRIEDRFQDTLRSLPAADHAGWQVSNRESRRYVEGVEDPRAIREAVSRLPNVRAISEVVRGSVMVRSDLRSDSAQAYGIRIEDHALASDLERQIVLGDLAEYRSNPTGVLIGRALARRLQVAVGDTLIIEAHDESRRYRISAIYETGVTDIDRVRVFMHMGEARSLLRRPTGASFIQVALIDPSRAPLEAERLEEILGHSSVPWQERERVWLDVFRALRISSALTVSTIILISGLGMFNTLAMLVMEKTREIAILRSMGYTRGDIAGIFLWQGALVLVGGTLLGWLFGALMTYAVSNWRIRIRGIFSTDTFVVNWSLNHYLIAALTAAVVTLVASLVPARRAARLEPGDVIRGTAQ
jgi:lipoprotein-releasing system permease protein